MKLFVLLALAALASCSDNVPSAVPGVGSTEVFQFFKALPGTCIAKLPKLAPVLKAFRPEILDFFRSLSTEEKFSDVIDSYDLLAYLSPRVLKFLKTVPEANFAKMFVVMPVIPEYFADIQSFFRDFSEEEISEFFGAMPRIQKFIGPDVEAFKAKSDAEILQAFNEKFPECRKFAGTFLGLLRANNAQQIRNIIDVVPSLVDYVPEIVKLFKYSPESEFAKFRKFADYEPEKVARDFADFLELADDQLVDNLYKIAPKLAKYRREIYKFVKIVPSAYVATLVKVAPKFEKLSAERIAELQASPKAYAEFFKGL